jgi:hypothetical protein
MSPTGADDSKLDRPAERALGPDDFGAPEPHAIG